MKALFDSTSVRCSKMITKAYSTSFSLGIRMLGKDLRDPIYSIYGFVRYADEIVDSFEGYDQAALLNKFWEDTWLAIEQRISLNPILHSFQQVVHAYGIEREMINTFLTSMEMDLHEQDYDQQRYETYILGSAEVVGLMCLKVFCGGDNDQYEKLRPSAM
ncbi:MAG: squalene/phytoene synthase family protein, partial [Bacteroidota bacterium]